MRHQSASIFFGFISQLATLCLLAAFPIIAQAQSSSGSTKGEQEPPNTQALTIPMTPPNQALRWMELPDGFRSTLFAAEPDIHQPIAVTTDVRGRLWVVECYTYSDRKDNFNTKLDDRIVIFEDTDQDGVFDNRTVFWDQGKKLTGIELGFGGVWVTAAPNLMFIPDQNQDDVPDGEPQILLDGFEGDVIRHNIVNGLRWGPDGWLYGRHGIQATSFVGPPGSTESQRTAMNCSIWRIHPISKVFEIVAQGGTNPWGFDFDEHGEMFMINTVIGHLFHVVPGARFRRMYGAHFNPHTYQVIEQTADHFHWDVSEEHWAVAKKAGMSDGTDAAGGGHAHTGLMIYQGDNWPDEFRNKLFTANFHGRRINSDSIHRHGNSYVAHHGSDYFKTKDPWFRGVELIYGPDGGVFILDWSDIGECHENDGIHRTSGRIFKITHGDPDPIQHQDLSELSNDQLIGLQSHSNDWYVRKARRTLQERCHQLSVSEFLNLGDPSNGQALARLWKKFRTAYEASTDVKTKLRIMWAFASCNPDLESWLLDQTSDADEHVRSWAVRLLADDPSPSAQVASRFQQLASNDPSGLVRLYLASSMNRFDSETVFKLADALGKHGEDSEDRVQPKLIWYGIEPHVVGNWQKAIELATSTDIPLIRRNVARRLTSELDSHPEIAAALLESIRNTDSLSQRHELLDGMVKALHGWNRAVAPINWPGVSKQLVAIGDEQTLKRLQPLSIVFGDGRATKELQKIATDNGADVESRRSAIAALAGSGQADNLFETLKPLIKNKALTTSVVKALAYCEQPGAASLMLNRFPNMDPEGRAAAVNTLVLRDAWATKLLEAVKNERVSKSAITASHARQIMNFQNEELTSQLIDVWGQIRETSAQRLEQITTLQRELSTAVLADADPKKGRVLYEKNCASCHILYGRGGKIGPDLTGSDRKNLNYLLENIVDPSASVAESYQSSILSLEDGRLLTGVIVEQNDRTIALQTKDELVAIDRRSISEIKKTKSSLMPDGLIDNLTRPEIADLFRFLSQ